LPPEATEHARWFSENIQPHEEKLRAWLRMRFPMILDLDDLVQETYLRVIRSKSTQSLDHPKAYLFTAARNAALDRCRRDKIISFEPLSEPDVFPVSECDDHLSADRELELSTLAEAIAALPDRCREVLLLRKRHGFSHVEIADKLGISKWTVNAQLTVATIKCREFFQKRGLVNKERHVINRR
jgi:RNA polymerase sigma factor (sigma-70 family)